MTNNIDYREISARYSPDGVASAFHELSPLSSVEERCTQYVEKELPSISEFVSVPKEELEDDQLAIYATRFSHSATWQKEFVTLGKKVAAASGLEDTSGVINKYNQWAKSSWTNVSATQREADALRTTNLTPKPKKIEKEREDKETCFNRFQSAASEIKQLPTQDPSPPAKERPSFQSPRTKHVRPISQFTV